MKFFPTGDVDFYVEVPGWDRCCKRCPNHSWKINDKVKPPSVMYYWRDLEGIKKDVIKEEDLEFKDWPKSRIRDQACLPLLYATGQRYIKILKAPPNGFKCAPSPINLQTARNVKAEQKKKKKAEKQAAKKAKKEAAEKKKAEKKDAKAKEAKKGKK